MMAHQFPLKCPPTDAKRAEEIRNQIAIWAGSPALARLVEAFGATIPAGANLEELVEWLLAFSEQWDFRRLQQEARAGDSSGGARWLLDDSAIAPAEQTVIEASARELGLIGIGSPSSERYDYALVLGGAKLSCLLRPRFAAQLVTSGHVRVGTVVLLGSARPIADSEREATDTYAPNAETEFDLINSGAELAFSLDDGFEEERHDDPANANSSWAVRRYRVEEQYPAVVSICAPSSEPQIRRANSADTYEFFLSRFGVGRGSSLLLVTSQIYVPYQHLEALRNMALPHDLLVETVGFPADWGGPLQGMVGPTNYLQEIRSTIQSAHRFLSAFPA